MTESDEVKDVLSLANQVVESEVWSAPHVHSVLDRVLIRGKGDDILLIMHVSGVELRVVVKLRVEEDRVEEDLSH